MRRSLAALLLAALATVGGCATHNQGSAVARLEARRDAHPEAAKTLRALGIAYYDAGRFADAVRVLGRAQQLMPSDGVTALYLGMSAEATGDLKTARTAYEGYVRFGRTSRVRAQLRGRLAALARKELEAEAKATVAAEATIGSEPGSPRTVAVLPLSFSGTDTTLTSLGRGLADLMISDLSRSSQLTVVERDRMDALLDEIKLSANGDAVDAATAVRSGRLTRAGRVVRGSITQLQGQSLRADAAVLDVRTAQAGKDLNTDFTLDALFDAEKRIVFGVFDDIGVALTPAERAAIDQRPTRSIAAFLAYSGGLAAEDSGRFDRAARLYEEAARLDPGFAAAQAGASRAQATAAGQSVTPAAVQASLAGTAEGATVNAARDGEVGDGARLASTLGAARDDLNPSPAADVAAGAIQLPAKDPVGIATGAGDVTVNTAVLRIKVGLPNVIP
ncbi:MAG: CsgG/HfaB family protein [Gemmatimonadaceae bacterium]